MVSKTRSKIQYGLRWLFLPAFLLALLFAQPTLVRNKIEVERSICQKLEEFGCEFSRNPDESREVMSVFSNWVGDHVGTSVDFVDLGGRIHSAEETREIVELCKGLPDLKGISFDLAEPTPETLDELAKMRLRSINLGHVRNILTDDHCDSLSQLRSVEYVTTRVGQISDAGIETVQALPRLRYFTVTVLPGTPKDRYMGYDDIVFSFDPPPDRIDINTSEWGGHYSDDGGDYYSVL